MAQMSFSWHNVGDIRPDNEFSIVFSDIDPKLVPAKTRVSTEDIATCIVGFLTDENTVLIRREQSVSHVWIFLKFYGVKISTSIIHVNKVTILFL